MTESDKSELWDGERSGISSEKAQSRLPEGCFVMLLAAGFLVVTFFATSVGVRTPAESELGQGILTFAAVSFSAAVVLGIWGLSLLVRAGNRE